MIEPKHSRNPATRPRAGCYLLSLACSLVMVMAACADNPPTFLFEIDASAVPGVFNPCCLALDSSNNVFVTDYDNNHVLKFAGNGAYLTQWGVLGTNIGQLYNPYGIALDSSNIVYVVDFQNIRVEKFDSLGNYLGQLGSTGLFSENNGLAVAVAVDSGNNVYVVDENSENGRIEKFNSNGAYLTQWPSSGYPYFVATDSGNNVYVTDAHNGTNVQRGVEKFDSNSTYLTLWGIFGTNNGKFNDPCGIAVDRSNNVYVTDDSLNRVEKFGSNGNHLTQWGSSGSGPGQFSGPVSVAVDSTGNYIYVADGGNARIQVFANNTNIVPPAITRQPISQIVPAGVNVTFTISAVGTAPLACQWTSNNVAVPGATNATFTLIHAGLSDSATYSVLVTNSFGAESSSNAVLAVLPTVVMTLPPSGMSATGAVLNASIAGGPPETVAWFDWGTDTNYGNVAGATTVPGNAGTNNLSAALTGISGNLYHYRIDAANEFGVVYGDDQLFTVGLAPAATTLSSVYTANGSTLNAVVNPNGWDTTVYFQWGTPGVTNSIPGVDIGDGVIPVNFDSFVPGLAPFATYQYQVVASNALGTTLGGVAFRYPPSSNPPFVTVSPQSGAVLTSLHSFDGNDGAGPNGVVQASDGNLYGTTYAGGLDNDGTVFQISTNGVLTTLYSFTGLDDGGNPLAGLVHGLDGNFYGTTEFGGNEGLYGPAGTVFAISTNGVLTSLYAFSGFDDGANPTAGLVLGSDGLFYGTTAFGGRYRSRYGPGDGTVFRINAPTGPLETICSFSGGGGSGGDGAVPAATLVQGSDGDFYGTTALSGGPGMFGFGGSGTVFRINTNGTLTQLYEFDGLLRAQSGNPVTGLVRGRDGNFYGTTYDGGAITNQDGQAQGSVFQISTNFGLTTLYSFTGSNDGANPAAGLVQGSDGFLYGTTVNGGNSGNGTVFAINTNGTGFTTLYSFSAVATNSYGVYTNSDGANPGGGFDFLPGDGFYGSASSGGSAGLILSGNTLYGTTRAGGSLGNGTVFSLKLPPPQLVITSSGGSVVLTWPANASGFILESAASPDAEAVWNSVSPPPVVVNGHYTETIPIAGTAQFYRLVRLP